MRVPRRLGPLLAALLFVALAAIANGAPSTPTPSSPVASGVPSGASSESPSAAPARAPSPAAGAGSEPAASPAPNASASPTAAPSPTPAGPPLRVGVGGGPPWLTRSPSGALDGFSIRLWKAVAAQANVTYTFVPVPTLDEQIRQIENGDLDIALGPLAITASRAKRLAFTQPYFASNLAILTFSEAPTVWERVRPFVRLLFSIVAGSLGLVLLVVAHVTWLVERERNPDIPRAYLTGVANSLWMTLVTMTTVGYGDRVPVTPLGRLTMGVWMILSTVLVSTLTAAITTTLTVSNLGMSDIKNADSLAGRRVAVVSGSVGQDFAKTYRAIEVPASTLEQAVDLLVHKRAEAVVYDEPSLRYYMQQHADVALALLAVAYQWEIFGYGLPLESPIQQRLNVALLNLAENGTVHDLHTQWFWYGGGDGVPPNDTSGSAVGTGAALSGGAGQLQPVTASPLPQDLINREPGPSDPQLVPVTPPSK